MYFSKKVQAKKNSHNWCSQQIAAELVGFFSLCKRRCGFWPKVQLLGNSRCTFHPELLFLARLQELSSKLKN